MGESSEMEDLVVQGLQENIHHLQEVLETKSQENGRLKAELQSCEEKHATQMALCKQKHHTELLQKNSGQSDILLQQFMKLDKKSKKIKKLKKKIKTLKQQIGDADADGGQ